MDDQERRAYPDLLNGSRRRCRAGLYGRGGARAVTSNLSHRPDGPRIDGAITHPQAAILPAASHTHGNLGVKGLGLRVRLAM